MKFVAAFALPLGGALLWAVPASAQEAPAPAPAAAPAERIKQVIVYGEDPCPKSEGDEIVVCARQSEGERYRIPEQLRREEPGSTRNEAWTSRVRSIEYVGRSGTESCSPVGGGGFTGCFAQIVKQAKAERGIGGDASWSDLVAAERAKRLSGIDAESQEVEARVKAEEAKEAQPQTGAAPDSPDHTDHSEHK